jgi:hypothetical protein
MRIYKLPCKSVYTKSLSEGCKICAKGGKLVLLITGLCTRNCFYCPLSARKRFKDLIFANECEVKNDTDIILEAKSISAEGTGITGGDPAMVSKRTLRYIELLKTEFGKKHHIHLYTAGEFEEGFVKELERKELDEIRFHIPVDAYTDTHHYYYKLIDMALKTRITVGVEIPVLPDKYEALKQLIIILNDMAVDFINLDELEFSETNYEKLKSHGYLHKNELSAAAAHSERTAHKLVKWAVNEGLNFAIHYCSAQYKDRVQLRNRLKRRARNTCKEYYLITDDSTFLKGIIEIDDIEKITEFYNSLKYDFKIPPNLMGIDIEKQRVEVAPWLLEKIASEIRYKCYIVEEYPTSDRLEVERIPLSHSPSFFKKSFFKKKRK